MTLLDKKRQHTAFAEQSSSFAPNHVSRTVLRLLRFADEEVNWFRARDIKDINDKSQMHTNGIPGGSRIRSCRVARRLAPRKGQWLSGANRPRKGSEVRNDGVRKAG